MKRKMNHFFVMAVLLCNSVAVFAQDFDEDDEGPEGPPEAPINKYTLILAIVAIALAWKAIGTKWKATAGREA